MIMTALQIVCQRQLAAGTVWALGYARPATLQDAVNRVCTFDVSAKSRSMRQAKLL